MQNDEFLDQSIDLSSGEELSEESQTSEALARLREMTMELREETRALEAAERVAKTHSTKIADLKYKIKTILEAAELDKFESQFATVSLVRMQSVKLPQGEAREAFYNYLKERGEFDSLISVNSNTLTAYVKREFELNAENVFFEIPGISPTQRIDVRVRVK